MSRHTRDTTVVSHPLRFSHAARVAAAEPEPALLHGVVAITLGVRDFDRASSSCGSGGSRPSVFTESLGTGYRQSPRGQAFLAAAGLT